MANQPSPVGEEPPPQVPVDSSLTPQMNAYLRTFSLWCRHGFQAKMDVNTASSGLMLQAKDTPAGSIPTIYNFQAATDGTATLTPLAPATLEPGTPIVLNGQPGPPGPPGADGADGVQEAPTDGRVYGRQSSAWTPLAQQAGMLPAGSYTTASTTFVMCGFGVLLSSDIATRVIFAASGNIINTSAEETDVQTYWGLGMPPNPGAAVPVGANAAGEMVRMGASIPGLMVPWSKTIIIPNLATNTLFWVDLALRVTGGNGAVSQVDIMMAELL